jgi:uncharacterized protein with PIN domain
MAESSSQDFGRICLYAEATMPETPRFVADRMVGRLARWLRLLGADVLSDPSLNGAQLLKQARAEGRIMLTRDKRLRLAPDVLMIESDAFRDQIRQVLTRFPFDPRRHAFTRCSECNQELRRVTRDVVARRVPPFIYASHQEFAVCDKCGRIFWSATHLERVISEFKSIGL